MDNSTRSLKSFLKEGKNDSPLLRDVREATLTPKVLAENVQRLRAIYERFVGVVLTDEQAKQKLIAQTPKDCCHSFFIHSPHLIPIMIAARDKMVYETNNGLCCFAFDGPRDDNFPISILRLCKLTGKEAKFTKERDYINDPRFFLPAYEMDLDKLVNLVYPVAPYSEPAERELSRQALLEITGLPAQPQLTALVPTQLPLPGFGVYAKLAKPKGTAKPTKKIDLHA